MTISTEYPFWFILFCLLLATGGSWILYRKNKLDISQKWVLWLLYAFRFLSIFIVSFLLLGPLVNVIFRKVEKPIIVIAIDNSESITANKDSVFYRKEFPLQIKKITTELQKKFELKTYNFGKKIKQGTAFDYSEKQTDIAAVFSEINNSYSNQNLGAVILASDGIYNEGSNPLYPAKKMKAPVFTVALGDTNQHKDLLIKNVKHNQLVYRGNLFPIQIDVNAFGCANQNSVLMVQHNNQTVFTKSIPINATNFFTSIPVEIEAKESGIQHYVFLLSKLVGEVTYANNRTDIFINVVDGKQKILLLALAPHPDIFAYKNAIENNENYSVDLKFVNDFNPNKSSDYNLVILHQLPGLRGEASGIIKQLHDKKIPLLYIVGMQTGINNLNVNENSVNIISNPNLMSEATPVINSDFSFFSLTDYELSTIKKLPPLHLPYGQYKIKGESEILFKQQIGNVSTDMPLIFFIKNSGLKTGFICGEGFWKWRLYDNELTKQKFTQDLIGKIVQYLAAKEDKSFFRLSGTKKRFDENETVHFDAEVYNQSYELTNTNDVTMKITNSYGKTFNFTFSKTEKTYSLDAGLMAVGNYSYEAQVTNGTKTETAKGTFAVMPLQAEFLQTVADHQLLNQLAVQGEGKMFYPNQTDELLKTILQNEKIKPVIYKQEEVRNWINLKGIFFLLLALFSVEWFVRKWNGGV